MPDVHLQPIDQLSNVICSSDKGLNDQQIAERQKKFGPNELRVKQETPVYVRFLRQFGNFFAILLMIGGGLALVAERLDPGLGNLYIASALFGVVCLNALFTFVQEYQSEKIMDSFREMMPATVRVRRDDKVYQVEASELVPGDIMLLFEGDKIPADGRLLSCNELKVDMSSLTGESEPVMLDSNASHKNLLESRNMVFPALSCKTVTPRYWFAPRGWTPRSARLSSSPKMWIPPKHLSEKSFNTS